MNIDLIITNLKINAPLLCNRVSGSADLTPVETASEFKTPCAYVIPLQETPKGNMTQIGGHSQMIASDFAVIVVVRNVADKHGEAGHRILEDVREEIRDALYGWKHDEMAAPVDYMKGKLVDYRNQTMRWMDVYSARFYMRKR